MARPHSQVLSPMTSKMEADTAAPGPSIAQLIQCQQSGFRRDDARPPIGSRHRTDLSARSHLNE